MKKFGIRRLRRAIRQLRRRFTPGVLILLYHRIGDLPSDPYLLNVTPEHFVEHLALLREQGRLLRLQQLTQALREGTLPHRAVVVTFDDGYIDNLYTAKPLLERYAVPATVFVTSGSIGQRREFWWDELDRLLLQPGWLPETLELKIGSITYRWKLDDDAYYSEVDQKRDHSWHLYQDHDPTLRHSLFRSLHQLLNSLSREERWQALDQLAEWAGMGLTIRSTHRTFSPEEVVNLAEGGLVEVGAHTVTHPVLSTIPISAQYREIQQSKTDLEKILGHPIVSFAYPHGSRGDYTTETTRIVQEAGFDCACSNFVGIVREGSDHFQLPRVLVHDCDGETFACRLKKWWQDG